MHYRLYFRDAHSNITTRLELGCRDDERAKAYVADITPAECCMELWQGDRLVTRREAERDVG